LRVQGEEAKSYRVVRLDSLEDANAGELVAADDITGEVVFKSGDTTKTLMLGPHMIYILRK